MKLISIRKPIYLGTASQVVAIEAEAENRGRKLRERKAAGRIAAGNACREDEVAIVRIAGSRFVLPASESREGLDVECIGRIASVDQHDGGIIIEKIA